MTLAAWLHRLAHTLDPGGDPMLTSALDDAERSQERELDLHGQLLRTVEEFQHQRTATMLAREDQWRAALEDLRACLACTKTQLADARREVDRLTRLLHPARGDR